MNFLNHQVSGSNFSTDIRLGDLFQLWWMWNLSRHQGYQKQKVFKVKKNSDAIEKLPRRTEEDETLASSALNVEKC